MRRNRVLFGTDMEDLYPKITRVGTSTKTTAGSRAWRMEHAPGLV